jgi:hypothetical protein
MEIEKINKACSNIFLIDEELCLSDSLEIINTNFSNLSAQINNIEKYYKQFESFYTFFENNSSKYFNSYTYLNQFSAKWDSAFETIKKYKNYWDTSPIYLIYPNLVEFNDFYLYPNSVKDNVVHWIETNFPPKDYCDGQSIKISLNLTKAENFEFEFKKSYDEKCNVYNSATKRCEKCNNASTKTCCSSNESCVSKTKKEYVNTLTNSTNLKDVVRSNEFDLNFLNTNFNIEYGAILKKGFFLNGNVKLGDRNFQSITLDSDVYIDTSIDRVKKILYLNYDIKSLSPRVRTTEVNVTKQISPARSSINTGGYSVGSTIVNSISLNIYNNNPVYTATEIPKGRYRLVYVGGAMSYWDSGDRWRSIPAFKINKNPNSISAAAFEYSTAVQTVNSATNYYGANQPWYIEFDHNGGKISLQFSDNPYSDNRKLNNVAPTFKLVQMIPDIIISGTNDGLYEMVTVTNPFSYPAEFTFNGTVDNELYLNDVSVTDFLAAKTKVERKLSTVVPANGTVKISVYTSQRSDTVADFAEVVGTVTWYCTQEIQSEIGFAGDIEWYAKCLPEILPISIENCDACKNCDVLADDKYATVECGKLSGDKTVSINYKKGISDRSIYRTVYISFRNNNNRWVFTT